MTCKCGAETYEGHELKVYHQGYPGHVYTGFFWQDEEAYLRWVSRDEKP